ncbi:hypothetical protein PoB_005627900 [Plakobranchus ocellatus]|uniref:Uncharacterized protein n=1 Tax=Plakobranchus ocellatus TaxID=259542 RepID=A0AAV4CG53_9GAST|nr:hypothetical protein PoB_005627900 [Plakobranchus ocellatus]
MGCEEEQPNGSGNARSNSAQTVPITTPASGCRRVLKAAKPCVYRVKITTWCDEQLQTEMVQEEEKKRGMVDRAFKVKDGQK